MNNFNQDSNSATHRKILKAAPPSATEGGREAASENLPALLISQLKRGCRLSNTTPQSIHTPLVNNPNCQVSGGLDWFEWSAKVQWDTSCFSLIFDQLKQLKEECQQANKPEQQTYLLGTVPVWVSRMGKSRGGGRGPHYPFRITVGGIKIALGDWQAGTDKPENLTAQLTGRDCLLHGGWESYQFVRSVVESLFGEIVDEA